MMFCPTCKRPCHPMAFMLSPDTRIAQANGKRVKLPRKQMQLTVALRDRFPRTATFGELIAEIWGLDEPKCPEQAVTHLVAATRPKLKRIGVAIVSEMQVGYRIEIRAA